MTLLDGETAGAYTVTLEERSTAADLDQIRAGLYEFNRQVAGPDEYRPLNVLLRDRAGELAGGLLGATAWGWLAIEIFWLRETTRGQGYGTRMLAMAEQEAGRRGCTRVQLDTLGFQAPAFYQARGYTVFGTLPEFAAGEPRYYLWKPLQGA
jgi:GNAT superfamily N-acetyltransferase